MHVHPDAHLQLHHQRRAEAEARHRRLGPVEPSPSRRATLWASLRRLGAKPSATTVDLRQPATRPPAPNPAAGRS